MRCNTRGAPPGRGDRVAAEQWTRLAERHLAIATSFDQLLEPKTKPASGPVMLDPKGHSPGGTPNWVLNRQRVERARTGRINPLA